MCAIVLPLPTGQEHGAYGRVLYLDRYRTAHPHPQAARTWDCAKCGEQHQHGNFCRECGAALLQFTCQSCGCKFEKSTAIPDICTNCGAARRGQSSL